MVETLIREEKKFNVLNQNKQVVDIEKYLHNICVCTSTVVKKEKHFENEVRRFEHKTSFYWTILKWQNSLYHLTLFKFISETLSFILFLPSLIVSR